MLSLRNICLNYGQHSVFQNLDLEVPKSGRLAVVGPSGSGKTSLLKLLSGLRSPDSGDVLVNNRNFNELDRVDKQSVMKKMGMLFQKNALFDSLTVAENIGFPLRELTNLGPKEVLDKISYALESVGILHAKDLYPDEISGGMQKRLGIARAMVLEPEILFYDDPTAGLDPITSKKIIDLILDLQNQTSSTCLIVTNDMNRAYQFAGSLLVLFDAENFFYFSEVSEARKLESGPVYDFLRGIRSSGSALG